MYFRVKITLKNNYHYTNKQLSKFDSNSIQITKQIKFLFFWTKKKESNFFGCFGFFFFCIWFFFQFYSSTLNLFLISLYDLFVLLPIKLSRSQINIMLFY